MTAFERQVAALGLPARARRAAARGGVAGGGGRGLIYLFLLVAPGPRLDALARIDGATSMLDADDLARWAPIDA